MLPCTIEFKTIYLLLLYLLCFYHICLWLSNFCPTTFNLFVKVNDWHQKCQRFIGWGKFAHYYFSYLLRLV